MIIIIISVAVLIIFWADVVMLFRLLFSFFIPMKQELEHRTAADPVRLHKHKSLPCNLVIMLRYLPERTFCLFMICKDDHVHRYAAEIRLDNEASKYI